MHAINKKYILGCVDRNINITCLQPDFKEKAYQFPNPELIGFFVLRHTQTMLSKLKASCERSQVWA